MSQYHRLHLSGVPESLEPDLIQLCFSHGASGVSENLKFIQPDLTYDPKVLSYRTKNFDVFFLAEPPKELAALIREAAPTVTVETFAEENRDWLEEWKKDFKPFCLTGEYWVVPSWLESPVAADKSLVIDPGMAFGTGTHATTQMAASFLGRFAGSQKSRFAGSQKGRFSGARSNGSMIDVGCGTGILSILAERLGWKPIVAVEIDPEARRVCNENIKLNQSQEIVVEERLLEEIDDSFDVVVANIIDGVLIKISEDLLRVLNPQGLLFATGILREREEIFFENFIRRHNLVVIRRWEKDEWVGFALERSKEDKE